MKLRILASSLAFAMLTSGAIAQTSSGAATGAENYRGHNVPGAQGGMPDYPHAKDGKGGDKPMTREGNRMPGGQGMMPDHPHQKAAPGSDKPMTHEGNNMPGGQGMMPDHPHQGQKK